MSAPTVREFGPASRGTLLMNAQIRAALKVPLARFDPTPRQVQAIRARIEPGRRVPVVRGTRLAFGTVADRYAEWVRAPRADRAGGRSILYLHGGGYIVGSPRTHRNLISRISHVSATPVLAIDYRLGPEHPLTAGLEDALAAYRWLLERDQQIVIAGDSAGGALTARTALALAEEGLPAPAGLVLLSPWADLSCSGDSFTSNARADPFIPAAAAQRCVRMLLAAGGDAGDWRLSPVFAPSERLAELPPLLLQAGSTEVLLDDSVRLAERAAAAGASAELQIFDRQPHVPPLFGNRGARLSLREIGRFVSRVLPEHAPAPPTAEDVVAATAS
jgi:acetyl esterase/lipase